MTEGQRFLPTPFRVPAGPPKRIVILGVPPVQGLDVVGPLDVFDAANRGCERPPYTLELVSGGKSRRVACGSRLELVATQRYTELRGEIDTLIVAGGSGAREHATPELVRWLAKHAPRARRYGSVCTGAYLLGAAGLLAGRSVTTHWAWAQQLASLYPDAHVDPDPIWLRDERLYSSAGVTAGIDLCLSLVSDDLGPEAALTIARYLVLYLHRPGGQQQFSVPLSAQRTEAPRLASLVPFMLANLRGDLSVPRLAQKAGMSPRNFARLFEREFSRGPGAYVRELRVEAARRSLESSERSLEEVADACGFNSAEVMGRAFRERLGVTPGGYRERFKRGRRAARPKRVA